MSNFVVSKSGVKVYKQWQDNIVIDADNPAIAKQSAKSYYQGLAKGLSRLGSENSEDALTWNIFRTLQTVPASLWLHSIVQPFVSSDDNATLHFWKNYAPPATYPDKEGNSEVDLAIETESALLFIEAKFGSSISKNTSRNKKRNQVIRNIDIGSWHASQSNKEFYFFLLTPEKHKTDLIIRYQDSNTLADELSHRTNIIDFDTLASRIYHIHWETIIDLLRDETFQKQADKTFDKLLAWLDGKF